VQRPAVQPWWRSRFQARHPKRQRSQTARQGDRRRVTDPPAGLLCLPDQNSSAEKRAHGQDHGFRREAGSGCGDHPGDTIAINNEIIHRLLGDCQVFLVVDDLANHFFVQLPVRLCSRRAHRRPLACIQRPELDTGAIDGCRHRAAEGVNFPGQVSFANAPDRRVAAHLPERLDLLRHQQRTGTKARRRERRFSTGVTAANNDDIESFRH
jgi:hypothetical protein